MKILYVFPYDLYPVLGGGSRRAISLINYLVKQGFEVTVLTTNWHNKLDKYLEENVNKILVTEKNEKTQSIGRKEIAKNYVYYRNHNEVLVLKAREEANSGNYCAIICNFLWTADCLLELNSKIIKILDIHDLQHERSTQFEKLKHGDGMYQCAKKFEFSKLSQADIVLCINKKDVNTLRKNRFKKKLLYVPYTAEPVAAVDSGQGRILFVGNKYPPNENGIKHFIKKIFPSILLKVPHASLIVVGKVCDNLKDLGDNPKIQLLGYVDDLSEAYERSDVVVAPISSGTGLKIKTIEALVYGKPLVGFPEAVTGIDYFEEHSDQIAYSNVEFVDKVSALLKNTGVRHYVSERSKQFVVNTMNEHSSYGSLIGAMAPGR